MSTFVLVHGAWHGGWCFKRVAQILRKGGHQVFTPTLTGLGERSHLMSPGIDLDTHIQDIVNVFHWEELSDVVLCGHSYGGMVITGVSDRIADKVRSLVYLDAFVPANGQSVTDFLPPDLMSGMRDDARQNGGGYLLTPIPAEVFKLNERDAGWVDRMCVKHPLACFEQKIRLTGAFFQVPRHSYVLATGYGPPQPFIAVAERLKQNKNWKVANFSCGHDVMLDLPQETAEVLIASGA
jgi:pimeloyl-ACP methyl ester carboxylesterase